MDDQMGIFRLGFKQVFQRTIRGTRILNDVLDLRRGLLADRLDAVAKGRPRIETRRDDGELDLAHKKWARQDLRSSQADWPCGKDLRQSTRQIPPARMMPHVKPGLPRAKPEITPDAYIAQDVHSHISSRKTV